MSRSRSAQTVFVLRNYALAVAGVVLATLVRLALDPFLHNDLPFTFFYVALAAAVWFWGLGPSLLCLVLTYVVSDWLFVPPRRTFGIQSPSDAAQALGYFIVGALIIAFGHLTRRAHRQAKRERDKLAQELAARTALEDSHRLSEEHLALAMRAAELGTWDVDLLADKVFASPQCVAMLGAAPGAITSYQTFLDVIHPDDRARIAEAVRAAIENRADYNVAMRVVWPDGSVHWIGVRGRATFDAAGRAARMNGVTMDVTRQKETEEALRHGEERFRRLAAATFEGIGITRGGRIIDANDQLAAMLGYPLDELIGMEVTAFLFPEDREWILANIRRGAEGHVQHRMIRKDGRTIVVETHGKSFSIDGDPIRLTAIRDITEQKQAEESLRMSEELLKQAAHVAGLGIFDHDHLTDRIEWSSELRRALGFAPQEAVALAGWIECIHPDDRARITEAIRRAHDPASGGVYGVEHRIVRRDGLCRWVSVRSQTFFQGEGQARHPVHTVGAVLDITERKGAEEALNEARQLYESLFQGSPAAITLTTEAEGRYLAASAAHEQLTGYSIQEVLGHTTGELHIWERPEDRDRVFELLRNEGIVRNAEIVFRRKSGEPFPALLSIVRLTVGGQRCIVGISTDITDRKRAEEEVRRSRDELERRVKDRTRELEHRARQLTRLTSTLTLAEQTERQRLSQWLHEHLQQLLVGAKLGLEMILRGMTPKQLANAQRVANLLEESINACRTLTAELSPPILHAAGLAAGLQWLSRWMAQKHGLTVELTIEPNTEPSREDLRVLLFQSARELLFNVVKHAGVTRARLELSRQDDEHLRVVISDQGAGFIPADLNEEAAKTTAGGFGLLSIRERLHLLGGSMDVEAAPGRGTRIMLMSPCGRESTAAAAPVAGIPARRPPDQEAAALRAAGHKICILLVDDHAVVREGLSQLLQAEEDLAVIGQARDGQEAVEQASRLHPDVILMDSSMPGMDGAEATRIIHAEHPGMCIIGLSMYVEADRADAMLSAGACAYLTKSGSAASLLATIRQIVAAHAH
jgi:PAS domain S-box-containing protein